MKRLFLVALAAAGALFGTAGAQAKAPPDGQQICGSNGACIRLGREDVQNVLALLSSQYEPATASAPFPFLVVRWQWPNSPEMTAYYVPATGKVLHVYEAAGARWSSIPGTNARELRSASAELVPFAVPKIVRVTVGRRPAKDPQSYLRLFGRGQQDWPFSEPRWIKITLFGDAPSPWTDATTETFVSRRGGYLSVDGATITIPLQLAQRIRRGVSLRG
jgi:hypothetical protein